MHTLTPAERSFINTDAILIIRRMLDRQPDSRPDYRLTGKAWSDDGIGYFVWFEAVVLEFRNDKRELRRTGTFKMEFDMRGRFVGMSWSQRALASEHTNILVEPLLIPGIFWDAIPLQVKLLDPNYNSDPFDGMADFIVKKG